MKINRALAISMLLNLTLAAWIVLPHVRQQHALNSSGNATNENRAIGEQLKAAPPFRPRFIVLTNDSKSFNWREVESTDYRQYIANLRAIGCPELTIKEIVTADVNDLFSARRAALVKTNHYEYWRADPMNLSQDQRKQLDELSIQRDEVLRALGIEPSSDSLAVRFRGNFPAERLRKLEFLPDEKRQSLEDLLRTIDQQRSAAGDDQGRLAELREYSQSAIRSLLTADEFHEYELRNSFPSVQLRFSLKELQPSEQEFRTIFDYWTALKQHDWGTPGYREAQQASETALRSLLGPRRFNIYLKSVGALGY